MGSLTSGFDLHRAGGKNNEARQGQVQFVVVERL